MWFSNPKVRGYMYTIVELAPGEGGWESIRVVSTHDDLKDATKVLEVLESVNYNFTCYGMMMQPVWEEDHLRREAKREACDHNGSSTTLSTSGDYVFHCPKCGKHEERITGWDANGSPSF
jgi:hypothetical protein